MPLLRRALLAALAGVALLLIYLWLTLLSPFFYDPPANNPSVGEGPHQVFVYGTLRYGVVRWLVYDRWGDPMPASLAGYRRTGLDLEATRDERVEGWLLTVSAEELRDLDRYERLGVRYRRVRVTLESGDTAWTYRRLKSLPE